MQVGFAVPTAGSWATPGNQLELAGRAEALGYASLWTFQRLLYPVNPDSPRWTETYRSVQDPLVVLGFLAGRTSRIRLGVAVLNMPWFAPIVLAKQLATLDIVSAGRLDVGLGLGWAPEEYLATGAPADRRGARAEDFIRCLQAIWDADPVEHHGHYYTVPPAYVAPKPLQRPHPPIILGGSVDAALRRAGRLAGGWVSASGEDLTNIGARIAVVRQAAIEAGRDPAGLRFICRGVVRVRGPEGRDPERPRRPLSGSLEEISSDLDVLRGQEVSEVFLDLNFDREIGSPDADPDLSMARAHQVLDAFAPRG
jgi:probable F420-dependent oxidoreductase